MDEREGRQPGPAAEPAAQAVPGPGGAPGGLGGDSPVPGLPPGAGWRLGTGQGGDEAGRPEPGNPRAGTGEGEPGAREAQPVPAARPARESRVEMIELVLPNDANPLGNILGGKVMHLMDIAGALAASRHSRRVCVTASVDSIDFLQPIRVGQAILLEAQVTDAGRTSMEVRVNVYSENLKTGERRHTATAFFTFVALDERGRPTPVPAVIAETPEEKRLQEEARERRRARLLRAGRIQGTGTGAAAPAGASEQAGAPAPAPTPAPSEPAPGSPRAGEPAAPGHAGGAAPGAGA